jgi:DNA replicative helicase MCM subunit Mcm2 (Cdc46/Mcm family)
MTADHRDNSRESLRRRTFEPRKSLIEAGVTNIIAEINETTNIVQSIAIEHENGDRQPIIIPITKEWYGDIRENFKAAAKRYFISDVVLQLDREIGAIYVQVIDEITKEQERRTNESAQKIKQDKAKLQAEGIETETAAIGDDREPTSVRNALFAKQYSILTVYGQISAMGRIFSMIHGGQYQCMRCSRLQFIQFERPYSPADEIPRIMNEMCRFCEREVLSDNEKRNARVLTVRRFEELRAIKVELMDSEALDDYKTLPVVFFGDKAQDVRAGEHVVVRGKLYILPASRRSGLFSPIVYAHDVKYTNRDTYELTSKDIERVKKLTKLAAEEKDPRTRQHKGEDNIINRLVWMYAKHVIWNAQAKEALLYAEASAGSDRIGKGSDNQRRKRINVGLVGSPGLGKTMLLRTILTHDKRNRFESGQSSSAKTLTAIVAKEGESAPTLRIGALPQAKEAVFAVNELGEQPFEDQVHFQDVMEEGEFTINKHGINATVRSDAVCIWTANPKQGANWSDDSKISIDEIPIRKQIIDRTDLLVVQKPIRDPDKKREFNRLKLEMENASDARKKILANYDGYIKIHLIVTKRLYQHRQPVITDSATAMLSEADVRIQVEKEKQSLPNIGSHRVLDTLIRLTQVMAKLQLKEQADEKDAKRAIEFYNATASQVQASINVPEDPAVLACTTIEYILQNESNGLAMTLKSLAELASVKDPAIKWYLYQGTKNKLGNVSTNARLRRVRDMLSNISSGKIKQTNMEEAEFLWTGSKYQSEQDSEDSTQADTADTADMGFSADTPQTQSPSRERQTKKLGQDDADNLETNTQPKSETSSASVASVISHNHRIVEDDHKIVNAMQLAALDYKDDKALGKESGSMFTSQDVWYHFTNTFSNERWDIHKIRKAIQEQIKKGRVMTRQGDPPDRYYLVLKVNGVEAGAVGGERQ